MAQRNDLRRSCELYLSKALMGRPFHEAEFVDMMEPVFKRAGYRTMDRTHREKILVIRVDGTKESMMDTGFLRELRKNKPQAYIVLVVHADSYPLFEKCPYTDEVLGFEMGRSRTFQEIFRLVFHFCQKHLWKQHFDSCILPRGGKGTLSERLLAYLSGARERIGFSSVECDEKQQEFHRNLDVLLSKCVQVPAQVLHEVERGYYLLKELGMRIEEDALELWIGKREEEQAEQFLNANLRGRPFVIVGIGAARASFKYPVAQYLKAFQRLAEKGVCFLMLGGQELDLEGEYFLRQMPQKSTINLIGQMNLRQMAAVAKRASLYIGNDTLLVHLAAAAGIPVIELLAEAEDKAEKQPMDSIYERFFPWKTPAIVLRPFHALPPCNENEVFGGCCTMMPHCIRQIPPQEIVEAYHKMMEFLKNQ